MPGAAGDGAGAGAGLGPAAQALQDLPGQVGLDEPPVGGFARCASSRSSRLHRSTRASASSRAGRRRRRSACAAGSPRPAGPGGRPVPGGSVRCGRLRSRRGLPAAAAGPQPVQGRVRGSRAAVMAPATAVELAGTCAGSAPARAGPRPGWRRLQRAQRPFSNSLSSTPHSAHAWVSGRPAQSAHMIGAGSGRRDQPPLLTAGRAGAAAAQRGWCSRCRRPGPRATARPPAGPGRSGRRALAARGCTSCRPGVAAGEVAFAAAAAGACRGPAASGSSSRTRRRARRGPGPRSERSCRTSRKAGARARDGGTARRPARRALVRAGDRLDPAAAARRRPRAAGSGSGAHTPPSARAGQRPPGASAGRASTAA